MRVFSFYQKAMELVPLEVELELFQGLPELKILGLPDRAMKESQERIKSALRSQGFVWPKKRRVLVQLKPAYVPKKSFGLDLAIAANYLWQTGQLEKPPTATENIYLYGQLGLKGEVTAPEDLESLSPQAGRGPVYSGVPSRDLPFEVMALKNLRDLSRPQLYRSKNLLANFTRPEVPEIFFNAKASDLLKLVATGEHSILLAGPAGSGKTTLAECLHSILRDPSEKRAWEIQRMNQWMGQSALWRPFVNPHHSIPPLSMIGGGVPPFPGEISRAHGGMLLLDEFLEFHKEVKEALREPLEKGEIVVRRRGRAQKFPADFLCIATTNLCPCGDFVPGKPVDCRFSLTRCRSYLERLSGPLLDRFDLLAFSQDWQKGALTSLKDISQDVSDAQAFAKNSRGQVGPNSRLTMDVLASQIDSFSRENLIPQSSGSRRRQQSLLRVARTWADLDRSHEIQAPHLERAAQWCLHPFEQIKRVFA